jgi:DNA repair exonuclease SbcCD ATPase subunit
VNPRRIRGRDFRSFEEFDVVIPSGPLAVVGANGTGKSSLASTIDACLFGPEKGRSFSDQVRHGAESMEIEMEFATDNEVYRIRRSYTTKGRGKGTLELERNARRDEEDEHGERDDSWLSLTKGSIAETQTAIEELTGLDRETFRRSAMLTQKKGVSLVDLDRLDRLQLIARAIRSDDPWCNAKGDTRNPRDLLGLVKRDRRAAEAEVQQIAGRLAGVEERLAERARLETDVSVAAKMEAEAVEALAEAEKTLELAAGRVVACERWEETWKARATAERAASERLVAHERVAEQAEDDRVALQAVSGQLAALPSLDTDALVRRKNEIENILVSYREAVAERERLLRLREEREREAAALESQAFGVNDRISELNLEIAHLESGELDSCPVCQQQLGTEARTATVASLQAQAHALANQAQTLFARAGAVELPDVPETPLRPWHVEDELGSLSEQIASAQTVSVERARLEERAQTLQANIDAFNGSGYEETLARLAAEHEQAKQALAAAAAPITADQGAIAEARERQRRSKLAVDEERDRISVARDRLTRNRTLLEQLDALQEQAAADQAAREKLLVRIGKLKALEDACSPDGLPAWIVAKHALPHLQNEASRLLPELGKPFRIELRTERPLKNGALTDALDIVAVTPAGEHDFEFCSGGEQTRIDSALRFAFAELLASRRRTGSRMLLLDEPTTWLDADGIAALPGVLLSLRPRFRSIILITHVPELRDVFEQQIVVESDGRVSRVAA